MNSLTGISWLWLIPLAPIVAAMVAGVMALTRRAERAAPLVTIAAVLLSACVALSHLPDRSNPAAGSVSIDWLVLEHGAKPLTIALGVHLDGLSWVMVAVVCVVSLLVQVYSIGYMRSESGYARYFAYLSLFTASMLGLVVADNLFQLYVCWELVGICSYLLIGFWWYKPSAVNAAKKAFVVTRFGDVGFLLGLLLLVSVSDSFQFGAVAQTVDAIAHGANLSVPLVSPTVFLTLVPLLLFCGAVGKSAQFPLHVWLPDAMEGPTPVSALIHAATMVAAGVYMVARLFPIFAVSEAAMNTVMLIGAVTALIGATIALVQTDIKKVLAYSTISQLGYMMLALGAGGQTQGMFHLVTHAMFKALLFLAAGSVIHALHHAANPNDLRAMGGLGRRMPVTAITCGIGVLALAGFPGMSGFWSKDAVLGAALENGSAAAKLALVMGVVVAGLTAFYATRLWMLAFAGAPRSEDADHAHESPLVMIIPLCLLAIPSVFLGWYLADGGRFANFLAAGGHATGESTNFALAGIATVVALGGIALAWALYRRPATVDPVERVPGFTLFSNLWYVDAFWNRVGAGGALAVGRLVAWFDRNVIDGMMNRIGALCVDTGQELRRTANGQVQAYTAVFVGAIVVAALVLALTQSRSDIQSVALQSRVGASPVGVVSSERVGATARRAEARR